MKMPELLAPAGDLISVRAAIDAGADAIYIGANKFNLRGKIQNLSIQDIDRAVNFAHKASRRIYLTLNTGPRDADFEKIKILIGRVKDIPIDALIIWDPGIIWFLKHEGIKHRLHLSTMSCVLNFRAVNFWAEQGISRVNLARELTYDEVVTIRNNTAVELEVFVHGSMCIAYAGRCTLSNYLRYRDTHRGLCSTPCRWRYRILRPINTQRFNRLLLCEDEGSAYILNSKNLCLLARIPELVRAGLDSLKIEGRQHNAIYVREVTKVYRAALDTYLSRPERFSIKRDWVESLKKYGERGYWEGFMFERPGPKSQNFLQRGPSAKKLQARQRRHYIAPKN